MWSCEQRRAFSVASVSQATAQHHTPALGSVFECKDDGSVRQLLLYLALELVPSTIFYFVVIFFNVRTTAPPYTAFVFFSQFFAFLYQDYILILG